jgi:DNA-binding ferritin-like protein (Dps family)
MNKILAKTWEVTRKALYFTLENIRIGVQWKLKVSKTQIRKWKRFRTRKELDQAYARVGAEIFALYKGGQTNWQNMPLVEQELSFVEAAESRLFAADEGIEEINNQYQRRKEEIRTKYRMKRSQSGGGDSEET